MMSIVVKNVRDYSLLTYNLLLLRLKKCFSSMAPLPIPNPRLWATTWLKSRTALMLIDVCYWVVTAANGGDDCIFPRDNV
ncbi:hypothetical protein PTKIN_Ptkin01aG0359000 [Pterospermum kingtungense]